MIERAGEDKGAVATFSSPMGAMPSCEPVHHCAGCGEPISDRYYLLAVDRQWHLHCLRCCECRVPLDSELTCFAKDGNIYCKQDYFKRFSVKRCARCNVGISASELVMRARDFVFHLHCFTCVTCKKPLSTGDQFGMRDELIFCRVHFEMLMQEESTGGSMFNPMMDNIPECTLPHPNMLPPSAIQPPLPAHQFYNGGVPMQKGRPRKRKGNEFELEYGSSLGYMSDENDGHMMGHDGVFPPQQPQRQKRMRTSFKHHQLRVMKSYFALNHNPDAKDLKQLAQKTGLSKRVLQVWFQNARAKYRRSLLRQENQNSTEKGGTHSTQNSSETTSMTEMQPIKGSSSPESNNNHPLPDFNEHSIDQSDGNSLDSEDLSKMYDEF